MQGQHFLLIDRSGPQPAVAAQGVVMRQINKDGTHFLCKILKKGYSCNEVVAVERMDSMLLFDRAEDLNAWLAENAAAVARETPPPPPPPPPQPLVDNDHVAPGCEPFGSMPVEPTSGLPLF